MYGSFGQKGPQSGYSDVQRSTGAGKGFAWGRARGYDEEAGTSLYPGLEGADAEMRWGFIRKVSAKDRAALNLDFLSSKLIGFWFIKTYVCYVTVQGREAAPEQKPLVGALSDALICIFSSS